MTMGMRLYENMCKTTYKQGHRNMGKTLDSSAEGTRGKGWEELGGVGWGRLPGAGGVEQDGEGQVSVGWGQEGSSRHLHP